LIRTQKNLITCIIHKKMNLIRKSHTKKIMIKVKTLRKMRMSIAWRQGMRVKKTVKTKIVRIESPQLLFNKILPMMIRL
jgi:hypothetical protein